MAPEIPATGPPATAAARRDTPVPITKWAVQDIIKNRWMHAARGRGIARPSNFLPEKEFAYDHGSTYARCGGGMLRH
ncbi:hypothetical protein CBM2637_A170096 [Cupriavidus taiwanensis]|nr:hypothetical protein CBM2637_A170096 [Cupriavidus taiwanensis]